MAGAGSEVAKAYAIISDPHRRAAIKGFAPAFVADLFLAYDQPARAGRSIPPAFSPYRKSVTFADVVLNAAWPLLIPEQKRAVRRKFEEAALRARP